MHRSLVSLKPRVCQQDNPSVQAGATLMSKGMNQKKQEKKKPAKTMQEKRAEKRAKKEERGFIQRP